MGWLVFWGVLLLVLAVVAFGPIGRRRGPWRRPGATEAQLREADRLGGMQSGWGTRIGDGGGS